MFDLFLKSMRKLELDSRGINAEGFYLVNIITNSMNSGPMKDLLNDSMGLVASSV
jgi:hypothetical protein